VQRQRNLILVRVFEIRLLFGLKDIFSGFRIDDLILADVFFDRER